MSVATVVNTKGWRHLEHLIGIWGRSYLLNLQIILRVTLVQTSQSDLLF